MRHLIFPLFLTALTSLPLSAITKDEALDFLYSGMAFPDSVDYSRNFYLENIETSLRARREMPWGKDVPDREFLHFVLPVRVNNESLDSARSIFYEELKDRVRNLSMKDAVLEVNHWCHEKVTYKPSDARTSSPLSAVSQAIGRCGEESTFTVAALRSVGIPARQIYTPRWAHTDDNHAWVEAWADGNWYFWVLCEPEPVLNLAWFNAPASRGLLMSTNVYGDYSGPEEVLLKQPLTTRINVTANYAPVATMPVEVIHRDGSPAANAKVNFCIYNYAEYYPAVTKFADDSGKTSLKAGLGDVVVWASDGSSYGLAKGSPRDYIDGKSSSPVKIVLDKSADDTFFFDFDIVPPPSGATPPIVTESQRLENSLRLQREDSIRQAYTSSFITEDMARELARKLNVDETDLVKILTESRGNHRNLSSLLMSLDPAKREKALRLLKNVSEKDRRDISVEVIMDNVEYTDDIPSGMNQDTYDQYILNPRIENEALTPWRRDLTYFTKAFSSAQLDHFKSDPTSLAKWIAENIAEVDGRNPQGLRMSPGGVLKMRQGDRLSKKIFFVAVARSFGIPARIDPISGATQFSDNGQDWLSVDSDLIADNTDPEGNKSGADSSKGNFGKLNLTYNADGHILDPKYYSQFSISKIEDGIPHLLEFPEEATLSQYFSLPPILNPGQYILTSGQRLADGSVLAHSDVFSIKPGETIDLPITIRQDESKLSVIGSLNAENIYHDLATGSDKSILSTTGRGYYVMGLISPNHEPSAHALNDLAAVKDRLENDGRSIMVFFDNNDNAGRFERNLFKNLPSNIVFGIDNDGVSRREITESLHLDNATDPIFVVADSFNRIVWVSTGYTIGIGETILSVLSKLE